MIYIGISVPTCLKHCTIGPYLGTHNFATLILHHTKQFSFSHLAKCWPTKEGGSPPFILISSSLPLILSCFSTSPTSLKFYCKDQREILKTSRFLKNQDLEIRRTNLEEARDFTSRVRSSLSVLFFPQA